MLDRLISGAGAVTDGADRSVRALAGGSQRGIATTRPGSLAGGRGPAAAGRDAGRCGSGGDRPVDAGDPGPGRRGRVDRAREPDLLHDPRCAVVHVRRVLQRRQRERHRGRGRGDPRLVLLAHRPRCSGRRHRALDEAPGGALHVPRDRDPDRRAALSARGLRGIRRRSESRRPHDRTGRRPRHDQRPRRSADADRPGRPAAADRHSRRADGRTTRVVRGGLLARSERRQGVRPRRAGPVRGARLRPGLPARHPGARSRLPGVHRGGHDDRAPPSRGACRRRREARRAVRLRHPRPRHLGSVCLRRAGGRGECAAGLRAGRRDRRAGHGRSSSAWPAAT